jgi:hypothetical protein
MEAAIFNGGAEEWSGAHNLQAGSPPHSAPGVNAMSDTLLRVLLNPRTAALNEYNQHQGE